MKHEYTSLLLWQIWCFFYSIIINQKLNSIIYKCLIRFLSVFFQSLEAFFLACAVAVVVVVGVNMIGIFFQFCLSTGLNVLDMFVCFLCLCLCLCTSFFCYIKWLNFVVFLTLWVNLLISFFSSYKNRSTITATATAKLLI